MASESNDEVNLSRFARIVQNTLNGFDAAVSSIMERVNDHETRLDKVESDGKSQNEAIVSQQDLLDRLTQKLTEFRNQILIKQLIGFCVSTTISVIMSLILIMFLRS